jgi:signal transduction histidine kinase
MSGRRLPALRQAVVLALAAAAALGLSSFRIAPAPGFELYLGPVFYLIAYRVYGLRVGVLAALLFMSPSWFWWGHAFSITMAAVHVVAIHLMRRRFPLFAESTVIFLATIGVATGYAFLSWNYDAAPVTAGLIVFRKVLNDGFAAALVDVLFLLRAIDPVTLRIRRAPPVALAQFVRGFANAFILIVGIAVYVAEADQFRPLFTSGSERLRESVAEQVESDLALQKRVVLSDVTRLEIRNPGEPNSTVYLSTAVRRLENLPDLKKRLGCDKIDDGADYSGPNDQRTFQYWVSTCTISSIRTERGPIYVLTSFRPQALAVYGHILSDLAILIILGLAASIGMRGLNGLVSRSVATWTDVMSGFGKPGLVKPPRLPFQEFDGPVRQFVAANNDYAALIEERRQSQQAITELKASIDLRLLSDVSIDPETGCVAFTDLDPTHGRTQGEVSIHPADRAAVAAGLIDREPIVEFRIADRPATEWYMLLAKDQLGTGHYRSGIFCRLRQPRTAVALMLHQSRLVEIGGMASAISHEMKQPLFTISLAAENGATYLGTIDNDRAKKAAQKFDKIVQQVQRAREIIDRISRYARIEGGDATSFDFRDVIANAAEFMRPMYLKEGVTLALSCTFDAAVHVSLPRVGFEQVVVNALQNALDAVTTRLAKTPDPAGRVDIAISRRDDGGLHVVVADNGSGLPPAVGDALFDPFFTTKEAGKGTGLGLYICRQIIAEAGGTISLAGRPEGGAALTIDFPPDIVID